MRVPRAHAPVTPDAPLPTPRALTLRAGHWHRGAVFAGGGEGQGGGREGEGDGEGEGEADIATGTGLLRGPSIKYGYLAMYSMYNMQGTPSPTLG